MSGSVQELMQQARAMLGNAPPTAENLNRAMLAITRGEAAPSDGFDMNAQVDRMMERSTPRRANVPRNTQPNATVGATPATPAPVASVEATAVPAAPMTQPALPSVVATAPPVSNTGSMPIDRLMEMDGVTSFNPYERGPMNEMPPAPSRGERMINSQANMPRRGTINTARPFTDETAGEEVLAGTRPRQALDTEDPMNLALGLSALPLAGIAAGAAMPMTLGQRAYAAVQADRAATAAQVGRDATRATQRSLAQQARQPVPPLGPMQQQALRGPNVKPRNMSAAQRQRRQNIAESP